MKMSTIPLKDYTFIAHFIMNTALALIRVFEGSFALTSNDSTSNYLSSLHFSSHYH